jgi:UDP-N-acetylmuramoylalanine--D-glutamate ligase
MRVLVLGAAVSGRAAASLALREGHRVVIYDRRPEAALDLLGRQVAVYTGEWDRQALAGIDLVVASPGFPERSIPITETLEAGLPLWSEIEFAARHLSTPLVAVTATDGKTTITDAAAEMLERSGRRVAAAGNIGTPLSDLVGSGHEILVVEVSSFQLRFVEEFHPPTAVLLNLAPDHLDWHGSYAAYAAAKSRIYQCQTEDDLLIFDADDEGAARAVSAARSRLHPVSARHRPPHGSGVKGSDLHLPGLRLPLAEMGMSHRALVVDLAAAAVAALDRGAEPEAVADVLRTYRPMPHRRVLVAHRGGVRFINDSKATNPHAAMAAVDDYPSVVLIAGGLAKGLDPSPVARAPGVKYVVGIGAAGPTMVEAAGPGRGRLAGEMREAVRIAAEVAQPGDVVLLAPACASYDMFDSYAARGEAFAAAVLELETHP